MSEPFVGEIKLVGFNFNPRGFANCDGQLLQVSSHSALFSLLGTMYGGDGRITFGLPDLRGRVPIHTGTGAGLTARTQGSRAGQETVTLNANQIPAHSHARGTLSIPSTTAVGNQTPPDGHIPATANDGESNYSDAKPTGSIEVTGATSTAGGGQGHDNMPPFLTIRFVIALQGVYPSRD
jgi:microcystin-dependent protein